MTVSTYIKDKKHKIEFKYHQFIKTIESAYGLIQQKVTSKFHKEKTQTKFFRTNINKLIKKSKLFIESRGIMKWEIAFFSKVSSDKLDNSYKENIDWTRGRFFGQIKQIIIRQGQIIEKVFVTPKGHIISVKRSELGLLLKG